MHYNIATLEQAHGVLSVNFDKCGNQYLVGIRNAETREYTHRTFDDIEQAARKFIELTEAILKGLGSEQWKRQLLLTD